MPTKRTSPPPAPTPPPEWRGRPGVIRGAHALHASSAYGAACELGLTLPPELIDAVHRASRANTMNLDVNRELQAANTEYLAGLERYVSGEAADTPSLDVLARAGAASAAAQQARDHILRLAEGAENAAVGQVRLASAGWIVEAKGLFSTLVDQLVTPVEAIPPTVHDLPAAARAGREVLARWQDVEDLLPRWRKLTELRESLAHITHAPIRARELVDSGALLWRDPDGARRLLPKTGDGTGLVVASVRIKDVSGLGLWSDAEIEANRAELAARAVTGRASLRRATRGVEIVA